MAKKKFIISKIRRVDIYKIYENTPVRKYVGQLFLSEGKAFRLANNLATLTVAKMKEIKITVEKEGTKKVIKQSGEEIGKIRATDNEKEIGTAIRDYIEAVRIARGEKE